MEMKTKVKNRSSLQSAWVPSLLVMLVLLTCATVPRLLETSVNAACEAAWGQIVMLNWVHRQSPWCSRDKEPVRTSSCREACLSVIWLYINTLFVADQKAVITLMTEEDAFHLTPHRIKAF